MWCVKNLFCATNNFKDACEWYCSCISGVLNSLHTEKIHTALWQLDYPLQTFVCSSIEQQNSWYFCWKLSWIHLDQVWGTFFFFYLVICQSRFLNIILRWMAQYAWNVPTSGQEISSLNISLPSPKTQQVSSARGRTKHLRTVSVFSMGR